MTSTTDIMGGINAKTHTINTAESLGGGVKVYNIRWFMLFLFVLYSMSNAFQWIQYSIIANVIMDYYGVESTIVDWLSMIFMITYIPLIFPASWYLEKKVRRCGVGMERCRKVWQGVLRSGKVFKGLERCGKM